MNYIRILLKKWYVVVLCAALGAVGMYVEKGVVRPPVAQGGDAYFTAVAVLSPVPLAHLDGAVKENTLNYPLQMWSNKQKFLEKTEPNFDYEKFCKGWSKRTETSKYKWIDSHFITKAFGDGRYEFTLRFTRNEPKNDDYIEANGQALLSEYVHFSEKVASVYVANPKVTLVDQYQLFEDKNQVQPEQLELKYVIIGTVLGALLGVALATAWNGWKAH